MLSKPHYISSIIFKRDVKTNLPPLLQTQFDFAARNSAIQMPL